MEDEESPAAASEPSCAARLAGALSAGCGAALLVSELGRLACCSRELASGGIWGKVRLSGSSAEEERVTLRFMDAGIIGADRFARMTTLHVQFCEGLLDEHLQHLPRGLVELNLDCCQKLTDAGVRAAADRCGPSLQRLSIYWNMQLTNAAAIAVARRCPRLQALCLSGCRKVGSAGVRALASRGATLTELDLTRLSLASEEAVAAVVGASAGLRELRLYAASQLGDPPLLALAGRGAALRTLDCTGHALLTDAALVVVGRECPALASLWLSWAVLVGDEGVVAVAQGCRLELLSIHGLLKAGPRALEALVAHCAPTLRALDVRGCSNVPRRDPAELRAVLPRLTTFILAK